MKKSKLYTKGGDKGTTSLLGGDRVPKDDERIELYGTVDHLNAHIGLVVADIIGHEQYKKINIDLQNIQSHLFTLGSNLATPIDKKEVFNLKQLTTDDVQNLELIIDELDSKIPELKNFVLPGGSKISAKLHLCRTVCRGLEREMVRYCNGAVVNLPDLSLIYINRLSDLFFVMARYVNHQEKVTEIIWRA